MTKQRAESLQGKKIGFSVLLEHNDMAKAGANIQGK